MFLLNWPSLPELHQLRPEENLGDNSCNRYAFKYSRVTTANDKAPKCATTNRYRKLPAQRWRNVTQLINQSILKVKVNASNTQCRALGLELIPMYRPAGDYKSSTWW